RLDAAHAEYEHSLRLRPGFADAHWAIATLRRPDPAARLARLRAALDRHAPDSIERAHIHYALFHELDALGEVDEAWDALAHGVAIMRECVRHDAALQRERLGNLMQRAWHPPDAGGIDPPQPLPVFV